MVPWLRIFHLPMQGTWVQALVREDSTCQEDTKPLPSNYRVCTTTAEPTCPEPMLSNQRSHHGGSPDISTGEEPRSPQLEEALAAVRIQHGQNLFFKKR